MFTGIILTGGVIESLDRVDSGVRLRLRTSNDETFDRGESVAVNGVCLTVMPEANGALAADVSSETLARTTIGAMGSGTRVNIERALLFGDRLGGHLVQGHVDAVGTLLSVVTEGSFAVYRWSVPAGYAPLLVNKGSIAVDGVSLTVVDPDGESFGAALIPETLRRTNLGQARAGDRVNVEFDIVAKYLRGLAAPYLAAQST